MLHIKSTKSFHKLPVAHMQWFDSDESGKPCTGPCSKWHGYDRSVTFEFSGEIDEYGWVVGFGDLKAVRKWLEYYFDHTAVAPANDPRMSDILAARDAGLVVLRVLPYGVSMEMSSLFIWEHVNPFIYRVTNGRAYVSKVECREHDANSAFMVCDSHIQAQAQAQKYLRENATLLPERDVWELGKPLEVLAQLNGQGVS